ncbi:hypothetical protein PanWU01x14_170650, partial [Parasponia andersonii]
PEHHSSLSFFPFTVITVLRQKPPTGVDSGRELQPRSFQATNEAMPVIISVRRRPRREGKSREAAVVSSVFAALHHRRPPRPTQNSSRLVSAMNHW